mgnify:CR=1 FL=1
MINLGERQYVWSQRNLKMNEKSLMTTSADLEMLKKELEIPKSELLRIVGLRHQDQSLFARSGYNPTCLLTAVFYLSKLPQ